VPRRRRLALAVLAALCAACGATGGTATRSTSSPPRGPSGPVGCLDPRTPATAPAGGWLPDTTGASDFEPENAGVERSPSTRATALGDRVSTLLGHGFTVAAVREFATAGCVVDREVSLHDAAGDGAFLRVLQLRRALNDGSFPLVGDSPVRTALGHGSVLLTNSVADGSEVTVVRARADGLVVELQVRSATGQDTSGWPTTMATQPPTGPAAPSPLTVAQAVAATRDVAAEAAAWS